MRCNQRLSILFSKYDKNGLIDTIFIVTCMMFARMHYDSSTLNKISLIHRLYTLHVPTRVLLFIVSSFAISCIFTVSSDSYVNGQLLIAFISGRRIVKSADGKLLIFL